ncbi:MAG: hypothetical protein ACXWNK_01140 [Vulcanimicrobiaceae bacterium]
MHMLLAALLATTLSLSPWTGKVSPTANPQAVQYRLTVHGAPKATVNLEASGLARGWIASFCTDRICSPFRVTMPLSPSGVGRIEFQVIRDDDSAPRKTHVTVRSDDGAVTALDVTVKR